MGNNVDRCRKVKNEGLEYLARCIKENLKGLVTLELSFKK